MKPPPALGVQPGTVLRGNLIHDIEKSNYGGWAIYPDEGSAHLLIENNVCYRTNGEIFHQHYGRENVIRNNINGGVYIAVGTGNTVRGNEISDNGGLAINLDPDGGAVNANDAGDADGGANNGQNYPVLTDTHVADGNLYITGSLNSLPSGTYLLRLQAGADVATTKATLVR